MPTSQLDRLGITLMFYVVSTGVIRIYIRDPNFTEWTGIIWILNLLEKKKRKKEKKKERKKRNEMKGRKKKKNQQKNS